MFVVCDIGGTHMRVAAVSNGRRVRIRQEEVRTFRTSGRYRTDLTVLLQAIRHGTNGKQIRGVSLSVAGQIDRTRGRVVHSPNMQGWNGKEVARDCAKALHCPVQVENDAVCAALGEAVHGGRREDFWFIAWGTGIGGAVVLRRGTHLYVLPSEPGQQVIPIEGKKAILEHVGGGAGIARRFRKTPEQLTAREWTQIVRSMAVGLGNLLFVHPVPLVVFGGGISLHHPTQIQALHRHLRAARNTMPMLPLPTFRVSALGEQAGLYGACVQLTANRSIHIL